MLRKLKDNINNDKIFRKEYFERVDIDTVLDMRDAVEFDDEWVRVFENIKDISIEDKYKDQINEIRECVFKKVYEYSNSSDMASYISDDFELICKAYIIGFNDRWLNQVVHIYADKKIPSGKLCVECSNINKELEKMLA